MALPGRALPSRARRPSPRPQPRRRGARPRPPLRRTARDRDRAPRHALVHDVDQATLTEAAETLAACGARLEHARALIDLGSAIRRTGKRAHAPKALAEGADLAQRCGATALVDHARHGLRLARPAASRTNRPRCADPRRSSASSSSPPRRHQQANRPSPLRAPAHRRDAPLQQPPQARHRNPRTAPRRAHRLTAAPSDAPAPRRTVTGNGSTPLAQRTISEGAGGSAPSRREHFRCDCRAGPA
jgi:hypothetical protein